MLFQLNDTNKANVEKLLAFAKQNQLNLSLIDNDANFLLPGKPLTGQQLSQLIDKSRKSGMISMQDAHLIIREGYNAG